MKTRVELIEEAYGEYFNEFKQKDRISFMGYVLMHQDDMMQGVIKKELELCFIRKDSLNNEYAWYIPKSILNINNNNGWHKIESEIDLPDKVGVYIFRKGPDYLDELKFDSAITQRQFLTYTHWREKDVIPDPLY